MRLAQRPGDRRFYNLGEFCPGIRLRQVNPLLITCRTMWSEHVAMFYKDEWICYCVRSEVAFVEFACSWPISGDNMVS